MGMSGQLHAPAALPQRKEPRYPLDRGLGGPQSRSGRSGEEKNFALPGLELRPPSPGRMTDEIIEKDLEGRGRGLTEVSS
jgi:hypothetical protein